MRLSIQLTVAFFLVSLVPIALMQTTTPWAVPLTLLMAAAIAVVMSQAVTQPIKRLTETAARIRGGDYACRADESRGDELGELARAFNQMSHELVSVNADLQRQIAQRQEITQSLRTSEKRFRAFFESAAVGAVQCDPTGRIFDCNSRFCQMLGYKRDEILGRTYLELTHPDDYQTQLTGFQTLVSGEFQEYIAEKRFLHKHGHSVLARVNATLVCNEEGTPLHVFGVIQDFTAQRQAEEELHRHRSELERRGRINTVGELAAGLAHELNQPLTAITNFADTCVSEMQRDHPSMSRLARLIDRIRDQGYRAADIVRRVRGLVRKHDPQRTIVDIHQRILDMLELVQADARMQKIELECQLAAEKFQVLGDPIQIEQVILNLLNNAFDAVAGQPTRRVRVETSTPNPETIQVRVTDTGVGLPANIDPDRLFESFYSSKSKGVGMGLNISRTIVEAHRGRLVASANPNGGAEFWFTLAVFDEHNEMAVAS